MGDPFVLQLLQSTRVDLTRTTSISVPNLLLLPLVKVAEIFGARSQIIARGDHPTTIVSKTSGTA